MTEEGMTENVNEHTQGHLLGAADIRRIAADAGISPTKKFGQNFVIDPGTVRRIVREAGVTADDHVLEVGPGLGSLTLAILETGATMTAVEIDPPVAERLPKTIAEFMPDAVDCFRVVNRDALTVNPENLPDFKDDDSFTLVANLPYNVATPILLTLLERFDNLGTFLVMVQKEVADKVLAQPGDDGWGMLSVRSQFYCAPYLAMDVPAKCFTPVPKVDSAFIVLPWRETPAVQVQEEADFFRVAQAAFALRRKTMTNGLCAAFHMERADAVSLMQTAGLDERIRGEKLTLAEFARLADAFTAWKAKQA